MGLDAIELVMGFEEAFSLEFADEEMEMLLNPQMVMDLISQKLQATNSEMKICATFRTYHLVRQALQSATGLPRWRIRPESKLRYLLPKVQQRAILEEMRLQLELPELPQFMPRTIQGLIDWIVAHYPRHFSDPSQPWTVTEIRCVVRSVIRDQTGVPEFRDDDTWAVFV